jgi:lipopolysaccharide export LptBFGC system permease protein LptF
MWFGTQATLTTAREPAWDPRVALWFASTALVVSLLAVIAAAWVRRAQKLPGLFLVIAGAAMAVCSVGLGMLGIVSFEGFLPALAWAPGAVLIMVSGTLTLSTVGPGTDDTGGRVRGG